MAKEFSISVEDDCFTRAKNVYRVLGFGNSPHNNPNMFELARMLEDYRKRDAAAPLEKERD